ncbi:hypothetical protein CMI45_03520 [Candidatus Pacearchaeota archaeon]|nr:hypothetical protein [Candidatus Pacearchaeota archaeon]|tara:strand:+ start:1765 stop:2397 length:633 start_codon:yes stop_codon:yes gene_type:complete
MYLKRSNSTTRIPIQRKGTKYVVLPSSHKSNSVPVLMAIRDMLKLAKTLKEVKTMINSKLLKINGKPVKSHKESIKLFNIFEADQPYILKILPTKRFTFEPTKSTNSRLCKIINKKLLKNNTVQINLHDGSNIISSSKDKISVNDSLNLSFDNKILSHLPLEVGKNVFIISGKYTGQEGKVSEIKDSNVSIKFKDKEDLVSLSKEHLVAI